MANTSEVKPWIRRMAEGLADVHNSIDAEGIMAILEAAGELKTARLKILLARCYELLSATDGTPFEEEFLREILNEIR